MGVILSNDLTWNEHVSKITSNINFILINLYQNSHVIPRKVKIDLVMHLAMPHFDYACIVYDSLTKYLDDKLQILQNRCIRFIFNLKKDISITPFRKKLMWLTVRSRREYFLGLSIYKILKFQKPVYLYSLFQKYFSIPLCSLRPSSQRIFDPPLAINNTYESSYHIRVMNFWNGLPESIRNSDSETILRRKNFDFLFRKENFNN